MILVIAEKPALARDIARAICGKPVSETARLPISGNGYTVTSCYGHLMQLEEPANIRDDWGAPYSLDVLPIAPRPWPVVPSPDKVDAIERIASLLEGAEYVIHCGDPDDEGQLIVDEVLDHLGYEGRVMRVYVNDNLEKSIRRAFERMVPNDECRHAGEAARARSIADMCFGVNESRLATIRCKTMLTLGRVQTPTLGLVVARDEAIEGHRVREFYELYANGDCEGSALSFKCKPAGDLTGGEDRVYDRTAYESVLDELEGKDFDFQTVRKTKVEKPPLPYDLTSLIAEMSKRFKVGAKATQDATQTLRENHHAITYNRTDSRYLKDEHYAEASAVLKTAMGNAGVAWKLDYGIKGPVFNDSKVTAHHAIIPTEQSFDMTKLSEVERKVYQTVLEGYARQFLPPAVYDVAESTFSVEGVGEFTCSQKKLIEAGWKDTFGGDDDKGATALVDAGTHTLKSVKSEIKECETKPPSPYTEGTLITDMQNVAKYVKDPQLKEILKAKKGSDGASCGGIGTSATRTAIIENLKKRGYVEEVKGKIRSTEKGREFYHAIPADIKTADVTAAWALIQNEIAEGNAPVEAVMDSVLAVFESHKDTAYRGVSIGGSTTETPLGPCPLCGKQVIGRGEKQKAVQCESNRFEKNDETNKWEQVEGCGFRIFRTIAGKKLSDAQIKALLTKGTTSVIKGFKSKAGKKFDATLKLDRKTGDVEFVFESKVDGKGKKGGSSFQANR